MTGRTWASWAGSSKTFDLIRLCVPIAVSRMSWMLMGLSDAIILGHIVGQEHELSYVLNSWLPIGICLGFGMGLLIGVQILTSELAGRGLAHQSGRVFRRGLILCSGLGLGLMALVCLGADQLFYWLFVEINPNSNFNKTVTPVILAAETATVTQILSFSLPGFMVSTVCSYYLEALRRPLIVTLTSYFGVGVNILVDLALVSGWWNMPQMGAEGVAWATVLSRWFITIALIGFVFWLTPAFKPSAKGPPDEGRRQIMVGVGMAFSNTAEWGGFNLTYTIAAFISLTANTVYGYAVQVMGFCFMFFLGIGSATSVRVAENTGCNRFQEAREAARLGIIATFVLGGLFAGLICIFNNDVAGLLVHENAKIDGTLLVPAIASLLLYAALATTFDGLQATASMALRAQGVVWLPTIIHVGSFFFLMIPACYISGVTLERDEKGIMEAVLLTLVIAGCLQWFVLEKKIGTSGNDVPT